MWMVGWCWFTTYGKLLPPLSVVILPSFHCPIAVSSESEIGNYCMSIYMHSNVTLVFISVGFHLCFRTSRPESGGSRPSSNTRRAPPVKRGDSARSVNTPPPSKQVTLQAVRRRKEARYVFYS